MEDYSAFYRSKKDKLFGYLMRLTGDYHLSSDIMQESFTLLLTHYGPESQNGALLFTIARNAVLDNLRKKAHRRKHASDVEELGCDPEKRLLIREEYRGVLAAMQSLDKDERDILALKVSSDLGYRDIAAIIGISEANVKVKIHRARIKLRKILDRGEE